MIVARLRFLWNLAQTPVGRSQIVTGIYIVRAWPLMLRLARLHRRTLSRRARIVTVVGSFGKTTTTRAVQQALGIHERRRLNANAWSHVAEGVLRIRPGQRHAVLEVGIARKGQMSGYASLVRPDVVVVTSIGSEHNRSFGTLEVTRHEKADMVRALPSSGLAVINGDDPHVRWMAGQTRARVITFGFGTDNEVRASDYSIDWPHGSRFVVALRGEQHEVRTRLVGRYQVYPILAAITVAVEEGLGLEEALARLEGFAATRSRLEVVPLANGAFLLLDEFKSAVETIETALETLAEIPAPRRLAVMGGISEPPGSQGPLYQELGQRLGQVADRFVVIGTRRTYRMYRQGARRAGLPDEAITFVGTDLSQATEVLRTTLEAGDVVLIKGRQYERLTRIALALAGRTVRCRLIRCHLRAQDCRTCPMLERGWQQPTETAGTATGRSVGSPAESRD
jgi:UDP-N-acetylmuramoyl-tripeptide--D-alanyl-D-alanine ligase